jgi:hypothetical protein
MYVLTCNAFSSVKISNTPNGCVFYMPMGLLPNCDTPYHIQYNEYAVLRLEIRVSNPDILEQTALHCFHTRSEAHPASYVLVLGVVPEGQAAEC